MSRKLTTEQFIHMAREIHGDYYDYSLVVYVNARTKVKIICPIHGEFEQLPSSHLRKSKRPVGCNNCGIEKRSYKTLDLVKHIQKTNKLNKYTYLLDYSKPTIKHSDIVEIICPTHGKFNQRVDLILKNCVCKKCSNQKLVKNYSLFLNKSNIIHNFKYTYVDESYINMSTHMTIICPTHGEFQQLPSVHEQGSGCPKCWLLKYKLTFEEFKKRSLKKHKNKYKYYEQHFNSVADNVDIICSIHGKFSQNINAHLQGSGCPSCAKENFGWSKTSFKKSCQKNNGLGIFYIIKCFNDTEEFYKIGITSRSIKKRFCNKQTMPYKYQVLQEIEDISENIWDFEVFFKRLKFFRHYTPNIPFGGSLTECYLLNKEN